MNTGIMTSRTSVATWLRALGTTFLLGSLAVFLAEGFAPTGVLGRAIALTGLTGALIGLGIVALRVWDDRIGARLFLGLSALTLPVHFALVAAGIHDLVHGATSADLVGLVVASGLAVALLPFMAFGASALVRGRGLVLVGLLALLSTPLLLPTRDPDVTACLALAALAVVIAVETLVFRRDRRMRTLEAIAARAFLLVPIAILLLRNPYHGISTFWAGTFFLVGAVVLLFAPRALGIENVFSILLQFVGSLALLTAALVYNASVPELAPLFTLAGLVCHASVAGRPIVLAYLASLHLAVVAVVLGFSPTTVGLLVFLPVGVIHTIVGIQARSVPLTLANGVSTLGGTTAALLRMIELPEFGTWVIPAILALLFLSAASLVERASRTKGTFSRLRAHFSPSPISPPEDEHP